MGTFLEDIRNFSTIRDKQCNGSSFQAVWFILKTNNRIAYIAAGLVAIIVIICLIRSSSNKSLPAATTNGGVSESKNSIRSLQVDPLQQQECMSTNYE